MSSKEQEWLAGVHSRPIFATRRAAITAEGGALRAVAFLPMLIMFGESDIYGTTTERLVARYPHARVIIIPDAGHVPWVQNRPAFAAAVVSFFQEDGAA